MRAPTGTGASRWSWSGVVCGPTVPGSGPSCVTWACRPPGHGQKSEPRAPPRTWTSAQTCSGGTPAADKPGKKLCGDIPPQAGGTPSYVRTWTGFVYLATVLDCCTKKVVGYAMADHMHTSLVCQAIDIAVRRCPVEEGVTVFHSDRGSQYTSQRFLDHLKGYGIRPSVGRTGAWLGGCVGFSRSMPRSRMKESTEWCTPRKTRRSRILPHGSS